jgi:hypothetical protein
VAELTRFQRLLADFVCASGSDCFSTFAPFRSGGSLRLTAESSPDPWPPGFALTTGELLPTELLSDSGLDPDSGLSRFPSSNIALRLCLDSRDP